MDLSQIAGFNASGLQEDAPPGTTRAVHPQRGVRIPEQRLPEDPLDWESDDEEEWFARPADRANGTGAPEMPANVDDEVEARISERQDGNEEEETDTPDMPLELREILSELQARFYELEEQLQGEDPAYRLAVLQRWLARVQQAIDEATRQTLAELTARGEPLSPALQRIADGLDPTPQLLSSMPVRTGYPTPEPQPASQAAARAGRTFDGEEM